MPPFLTVACRFLLLLALLPPLSAHLHAANIMTDETAHAEDPYENSYMRGRGNGYASRLGMATFEGTLYYASRSKNGDAVTLRPAIKTGAPYESHPTRNKDLFTIFNPGQGQLLVAELIPVGERLFLVAYLRDVVFVQAYRRLGGAGPHAARLVETGELSVIKVHRNLAGATLRQVFALHGDRGLTVHVIWGGASADPSGLYFAAYRYRKGEMESSADPVRLAAGTSVRQPTSCDGVSTHRLDAQGNLEEVHVLTFVTSDNRLKVYGYYPDGTYRDQNCTLALPANDVAGLVLCQGQFEGDENPDYSLSLLYFYLPPGGRHTGIHQYGLSVPQLGTVITGPNVVFFRNVESVGNAQGTTVHWGVDKTVIRPRGPDRVKATNVSFHEKLQQVFRIACVNFYVRKITFGPNEDYQSFRTGVVGGNRFFAEKDCVILNTSRAIENPAKANLLSTWTLVGVVHGMPPYIQHVAGRDFPTVSIDFSRTLTETNSTTTFTTDGHETSVAVNIGGEYGGKPDAKSFLLDIGGSLAWGVENAHSETLTTTHSATVGSRTTLNPVRNVRRNGLPDEAVPENIGYVFYSAPVFASVNYRIVRPSGAPFSEQRLCALTAVDRRVNQDFSYLLDAPEKGPLETLRPDGTNPLAALTAGIAPVPRTNRQNLWKDVQVRGARKQFPVESSGFGATKNAGGGFTIAFSTETGESSTDSRTYTRRQNAHAKFGLVNIFNVETSYTHTSSDGFSHEVTTTTTIGTGITGEYPQLPDNQPVNKLTILPHFFYPDPAEKADWEPTLLQGSGSGWLLTWQVETFLTRPSSLARKPWKLRAIERRSER